MSTLAETFDSLHRQDKILILPNAWDAVSAKIIEEAGAQAIASTSAGVAWSLGFPDGNMLPIKALGRWVESVTDVIRVPLTVDFEGGYTQDASAIANNLYPILDAGAVGINIEDGEGAPDLLQRKIEQARKAAEIAGVKLFINARTDVYLADLCPPEHRAIETISRAARYREAGADGIFIPHLTDTEHIRVIVQEVKMPVNLMASPGLAQSNLLTKLGVRRLSTGGGLARVVWNQVAELAKSFLATGNSQLVVENAMAYSKLQKFFDLETT